MKFVKLLCLLVLPAFLIVGEVKAVEKHKEQTGRSGTVYFMMRMAYPMPTEHMSFLSKVHHVPGLKVYTTFNKLSEQQMKAYAKNPSAFIESTFTTPENYIPDPEKLKALAGTIRQFDMVEPAPGIIQKYRVKDFPSFLYLTPDGDLYRFPYKAFAGDASEKRFWRLLEKNKNNKPLKNMWENKKWSM